jgi:hypothetical protein
MKFQAPTTLSGLMTLVLPLVLLVILGLVLLLGGHGERGVYGQSR